MKVRGNLKVLGDLYVNGNPTDLLYVGLDGKITYDNLKVGIVIPTKKYSRNSIVANVDSSKIYLARIIEAPGDELTDSTKWLDISAGGSGGSGGIEEHNNYASLPRPGQSEVIYITLDTNTQYRWDTSLLPTPDYTYLSGGIPIDIKASMKVGGIDKNESVLEGSRLNDFINQLINPEIKAAVTSLESYNFSVNLSSIEPIGLSKMLTYTEDYKTGNIKGYDVLGASTNVDLKGPGSYTHTIPNNTNIIIKEDNEFDGKCTYLEGTDPIYSSTQIMDTAIDRSGSFIDKTRSVTGYYPVYTGGSSLTSAEVINALQSGSVPPNFKTINYTNQEIVSDTHTIIKGLQFVYMILPKDKFVAYKIISSTFETIIDIDDYISEFNIQLGSSLNPTPYRIYGRDVNKYTDDMSVDIKINNV